MQQRLGNRAIRGALLGTGSIAIHHMRGWQEVSGVQIVALANRTLNRASALGQQFQISDTHIYADYRELLEREPIDFVDIATAPHVHHEQVLAAAARGVHVLCQKPFAPSIPEALEMIQACEAGGLRCIVHENWRWRSWYRALKELIGRGTLGHCRYACFRVHTDLVLPGGGHPNLNEQVYTAEMPRLVLYDWGIHLIDVLRFLFGNITRVFARMSRTSRLVRGEDMAIVVLEMASDLTSMLDLSWGTIIPLDRRLPRGSLDPLMVEGDRGTVEFDPYLDDAIILTTPVETKRWSAHPGKTRSEAYQDSYQAMLAHFTSCLRTGMPAETEARDNLGTLEATLAAYEAAERQTVVTVGLSPSPAPPLSDPGTTRDES